MRKADTQTSLRLPTSLLDRVAAAAAANGRSTGAEIRRRLEQSFASKPAAPDQETTELITATVRIASLLSEWFPDAWHSDPFLYRAFRLALDKLLTHYAPDGHPTPLLPKPDGFIGGKVSVAAVSAMLFAIAVSDLREARQ